MSTCMLCGKDLSEGCESELCENCQGLSTSSTQNHSPKTAPPKRKLWQRSLPFLVSVLVVLLFIYIPRIGTADAKAAAEHAVQQLIQSETGALPYTQANFVEKSQISVVFIVRSSATTEDMKQGKYSERLVGVSSRNDEISFISDPYSSDESELP